MLASPHPPDRDAGALGAVPPPPPRGASFTGSVSSAPDSPSLGPSGKLSRQSSSASIGSAAGVPRSSSFTRSRKFARGDVLTLDDARLVLDSSNNTYAGQLKFSAAQLILTESMPAMSAPGEERKEPPPPKEMPPNTLSLPADLRQPGPFPCSMPIPLIKTRPKPKPEPVEPPSPPVKKITRGGTFNIRAPAAENRPAPKPEPAETKEEEKALAFGRLIGRNRSARMSTSGSGKSIAAAGEEETPKKGVRFNERNADIHINIDTSKPPADSASPTKEPTPTKAAAASMDAPPATGFERLRARASLPTFAGAPARSARPTDAADPAAASSAQGPLDRARKLFSGSKRASAAPAAPLASEAVDGDEPERLTAKPRVGRAARASFFSTKRATVAVPPGAPAPVQGSPAKQSRVDSSVSNAPRAAPGIMRSIFGGADASVRRASSAVVENRNDAPADRQTAQSPRFARSARNASADAGAAAAGAGEAQAPKEQTAMQRRIAKAQAASSNFVAKAKKNAAVTRMSGAFGRGTADSGAPAAADGPSVGEKAVDVVKDVTKDQPKEMTVEQAKAADVIKDATKDQPEEKAAEQAKDIAKQKVNAEDKVKSEESTKGPAAAVGALATAGAAAVGIKTANGSREAKTKASSSSAEKETNATGVPAKKIAEVPEKAKGLTPVVIKSSKERVSLVEEVATPVESKNKSVDSKTKSVERKSKSKESNTKSVESKTKSVESKTKSLERKTKSVERKSKTSVEKEGAARINPMSSVQKLVQNLEESVRNSKMEPKKVISEKTTSKKTSVEKSSSPESKSMNKTTVVTAAAVSKDRAVTRVVDKVKEEKIGLSSSGKDVVEQPANGPMTEVRAANDFGATTVDLPEYVTIKRIIRRVKPDGTEEIVTRRVREKPTAVRPNGDVVVQRTVMRLKEDGSGEKEKVVIEKVVPRRASKANGKAQAIPGSPSMRLRRGNSTSVVSSASTDGSIRRGPGSTLPSSASSPGDDLQGEDWEKRYKSLNGGSNTENVVKGEEMASDKRATDRNGEVPPGSFGMIQQGLPRGSSFKGQEPHLHDETRRVRMPGNSTFTKLADLPTERAGSSFTSKSGLHGSNSFTGKTKAKRSNSSFTAKSGGRTGERKVSGLRPSAENLQARSRVERQGSGLRGSGLSGTSEGRSALAKDAGEPGSTQDQPPTGEKFALRWPRMSTTGTRRATVATTRENDVDTRRRHSDFERSGLQELGQSGRSPGNRPGYLPKSSSVGNDVPGARNPDPPAGGERFKVRSALAGIMSRVRSRVHRGAPAGA